MQSSIAREVGRQIEREVMLPAGGVAVVAVSGGADSVCLLLALHELAMPLVVAHLDHGMRGAAAADDALFVQRLAGCLGVPCEIGYTDVPALQRERKLSSEAAAREARYAFLRDVAARRNANAIFVAHTADDQVETFLLRLIRGAGVAGLAGMRPKDGQLCRPLLGVWRTEVETYLRERGQPWREDASNTDRRFLRNRVRHELLPLLASMNAGIKQVLLREARQLAERQSDVEAEVLRQVGLTSRQIAAALDGKPVSLPGGREFRIQNSEFTRPPEPFEVPLPVPGRALVDGIGTISAELSEFRIPNSEFIDGGLVKGELTVRGRRPGDRFVPLGMQEPKKLQDFFVDEHVPRAQRDRVPLVVDGDTILWVGGMRLDERYKLTAATKRVLRLTFERA